jgi:hypothetical protein
MSDALQVMQHWRDALLTILGETERGPGDPGWYVDAGFVQSLAPLSADAAAQPVCGSSIAQHVKHSAFIARHCAALLSGQRLGESWDSSWLLEPLDEAGWTQLKDALSADLDRLRAALMACSFTDPFHATDSVAAVAHLAYHLGAVRQKLLHL